MTTRASIRDKERETIEAFLRHNRPDFAAARVLDYGCGQQPYRGIVEGAGGTYHGYDRKLNPGSVVGTDVGEDDPLVVAISWDVIICTQVIQYMLDPLDELERLFAALRYRGVLLLTGPTNWEEIEDSDRQRFTVAGMREILAESGFTDVAVWSRHGITVNDIGLSLGWAARAIA